MNLTHHYFMELSQTFDLQGASSLYQKINNYFLYYFKIHFVELSFLKILSVSSYCIHLIYICICVVHDLFRQVISHLLQGSDCGLKTAVHPLLTPSLCRRMQKDNIRTSTMTAMYFDKQLCILRDDEVEDSPILISALQENILARKTKFS